MAKAVTIDEYFDSMVAPLSKEEREDAKNIIAGLAPHGIKLTLAAHYALLSYFANEIKGGYGQ